MDFLLFWVSLQRPRLLDACDGDPICRLLPNSLLKVGANESYFESRKRKNLAYQLRETRRPLFLALFSSGKYSSNNCKPVMNHKINKEN